MQKSHSWEIHLTERVIHAGRSKHIDRQNLASLLGSSGFSRSLQLPQSVNGGLGCQGCRSSRVPCSASEGLTTGLAAPDSYSHSPDSDFTTELAGVNCVLVLLDLLDGLAQGSTIPGGVLANDAHLLGPLPHLFPATERLRLAYLS